MRRIILGVALAASLTLGGCATDGTAGSFGESVGNGLTRFATFITGVDANVRKYAPIVGRTLIAIGDIVYQVECNPATPAAGKAAANIFKVLAPNTTAASKFETRVEENDEIAAQLCPLANQIVLAVGSVPAGPPSQVIPATP